MRRDPIGTSPMTRRQMVQVLVPVFVTPTLVMGARTASMVEAEVGVSGMY